MTKPIETPAVIIPREHQSAPKKHWAQGEIEKATEEIIDGKFIVKPNEEEMFDYGFTQTLASHPRVQEAMARLEKEKVEGNSQEAAEKAQMLWEMNEMAAQADKWDGQGRWLGKENEGMRIVNILTPFTFIQRLEAAGLYNRVELNSYAVLKRAALMAWQFDPLDGVRKRMQVGTLQYPCGPEWMVMRFNEYGVPTTAKYLGWRTALLAMITQGIVTEKEAHTVFPLSDGPAGEWYREQLQIFRANQDVKRNPRMIV